MQASHISLSLLLIQRILGIFIRFVNLPIGLSADTNCEKWIRKSLIKEDVIKDILRVKHIFMHCDLKNIIISI